MARVGDLPAAIRECTNAVSAVGSQDGGRGEPQAEQQEPSELDTYRYMLERLRRQANVCALERGGVGLVFSSICVVDHCALIRQNSVCALEREGERLAPYVHLSGRRVFKLHMCSGLFRRSCGKIDRVLVFFWYLRSRGIASLQTITSLQTV